VSFINCLCTYCVLADLFLTTIWIAHNSFLPQRGYWTITTEKGCSTFNHIVEGSVFTLFSKFSALPNLWLITIHWHIMDGAWAGGLSNSSGEIQGSRETRKALVQASRAGWPGIVFVLSNLWGGVNHTPILIWLLSFLACHQHFFWGRNLAKFQPEKYDFDLYKGFSMDWNSPDFKN
jgi:hypothetical protein